MGIGVYNFYTMKTKFPRKKVGEIFKILEMGKPQQAIFFHLLRTDYAGECSARTVVPAIVASYTSYWITVQQAAAILKVTTGKPISDNQVTKYCRDEELQAGLKSRRWLVSLAAVLNFERRKPGPATSLNSVTRYP